MESHEIGSRRSRREIRGSSGTSFLAVQFRKTARGGGGGRGAAMTIVIVKAHVLLLNYNIRQ